MEFTRVKITNYKSFKDSGWVSFKAGFNVIIGANNAGKTAFLEVIALNFNTHPHKSLDYPEGAALSEVSAIDFEIIVNGEAFKRSLLLGGKSGYWMPIPNASTQPEGEAFVRNLFDDRNIPFYLRRTTHVQLSKGRNPALGLINPGPHWTMHVTPAPDLQSLNLNPISSGNQDDTVEGVARLVYRRLYVFKAERLKIGKCPIQESPVLLPDAGNLPACLANLFENPDLYKAFVENVNKILPNVKYITIAQRGSQELEIMVWSVAPETRRKDLAIRLSDGGTGLSQVLAILYVVMTQSKSVIAIDEPNSFLHPSAAKKLIQILKEYPHQYILSTHSPELILAAEPTTLHLIKHENGQSRLDALNGDDVQDTKRILSEVGVGLAEVFGADALIWVEGPTEQECFPLIYKHFHARLPLGISFVALVNTGDLEARNKASSQTIWNIYSRLSTVNALMPTTLAFSLDLEGRTDADKEELGRRSGGLVKFLPRKLYENYLVLPNAITAVLNDEIDSFSTTLQIVTEWLETNAPKAKYTPAKSWKKDLSNVEWLKVVDGAKLLSDLFDAVSGETIMYRKTTHSAKLTEWILKHSPDSLTELKEYIETLLPV